MSDDPREKLINLLDYVEQVIRLDERVVYKLSEYRLPDGTAFAVSEEETRNLPGVKHDIREEDDSVWLEVPRLSRKHPPAPPQEIADWIVVSADPATPPERRSQLMLTVSASERDALIAQQDVRQEDVVEALPNSANSQPRYDVTLRLEDRPTISALIDSWVLGPWTAWSAEELPRRRTIALYQRLYKVFQILESAAETGLEVIWGIGIVRWQKDGRLVDRPLIELRVDVELDESKSGSIRIRPTSAEPSFDLKPYEEFGCVGLQHLSDVIRIGIKRATDDGELSPYRRETFEPMLSAAASLLDSEGCYLTSVTETDSTKTRAGPDRLVINDKWVLFGRPRSQHVVLQDVDRLRQSVNDSTRSINGMVKRLVTEPSTEPPRRQWEPLGGTISEQVGNGTSAPSPTEIVDVFFPKPFNDDQIKIVKRLQNSDGLVIQGPPGTGKTHTIANLICHAMATGKRVLVTSHGESALAVLRDQLPKEIQPLAISILSSERKGLRQLEDAIREIQSVVEATQPDNRVNNIRRMEAELEGLRQQLAAIDSELDAIGAVHLSKIGPRGETPAQLAQRLISERNAFSWFLDKPTHFSTETSLNDSGMEALIDARRRVGQLLDHLEADLPSPADLPKPNMVRAWHEDLTRAVELVRTAKAGPAFSLRISSNAINQALALVGTLEALAETHPATLGTSWAEPFRRAGVLGEENAWAAVLRERLSEWVELDSQRAALARRSVELPQGFLANQDAWAAIKRGAAGERLWPVLALGKGAARALVSAIKLDGLPVEENDIEGWRHIIEFVSHSVRRQQITARWRAFATEAQVPTDIGLAASLEAARIVMAAADSARAHASFLASVTSGSISTLQLIEDPKLCRSLAQQIRAVAGAIRLAGARQHIRSTIEHFENRPDPTSQLVMRFLSQVIGKQDWTGDKVEENWRKILVRIGRIRERAADFKTIITATDLIAQAGAPIWAQRLKTEVAPDSEHVWRSNWRDAWDHATADAKLSAIAAGERMSVLARNRETAETRRRKLFAELVRERTFYELDKRLSPSVKAALVQFVVALTRIGKGTGKGAGLHRRTARDALAKCYDAVPCWIMPTWRVAEQLPPNLNAVDLVIIDEASQSDVTELPALLRGQKILVVGDDRQVSPTAPFVTQTKIRQLHHHHLRELPFKNLLEPGESIYHLMRAAFPDEGLMLKEHFRCVESIIRFSMQFYPEKLLPLRIPSAQKRLDPPLIDIYLPYGARNGRRKINAAEADVIVDEITSLTKQATMQTRSIGVISLLGSEQADFIRRRLSETIGEELMQRHAILCGDSATFQGTERDIVFLSMVADSVHHTALTMVRYEQRFNVAASRARDRLVLVRSVKREELNENDLKAKLIAHFENPMPDVGELVDEDECDSQFERDVMQMLIARGYRVRPQAGSIGFRIDLVVEGGNGRRLAVECDGDRFHGPEQWREDMRRQRVLERVGWRFWRCFASDFYRDSDRVFEDLLQTLGRMGIEPCQNGEKVGKDAKFTEHRIIDKTAEPESSRTAPETSSPQAEIEVGDQIALLFADDRRRISARLTESTHDLDKGAVAITSTLGAAIINAQEGDEIEFSEANGSKRRALIESVQKADGIQPLAATKQASAEHSSKDASPLVVDGNAGLNSHRVDQSLQNGAMPPRREKTVIHQGRFEWGQFQMFDDGSVELQTANETRWFRSFTELESALRGSSDRLGGVDKNENTNGGLAAVGVIDQPTVTN